MDPIIMTAIMATFFFASFLKGAAGLGFATSCLGIMASYLDMRVAIPLVVLPSLLANAVVMVDAGGFAPIFRRFWVLYLSAVPGLLLGLWVLGGGDTLLPRTVLGICMAAYGAWGLWGGRIGFGRSRPVMAAVGMSTGLINGLTGSQIMPILPYLISLDITKDELVQAINTSFTFASLIMLVGLGRIGLFSGEVAWLSLIGVVPVGAGIWLGGRVRRLLPEAVFRKLVLALVALLGVSLAVRPLFV